MQVKYYVKYKNSASTVLSMFYILIVLFLTVNFNDPSPRPLYPKSWLWSPEEAAIVIQAGVRGYFIRCLPEVQEMRQFWKVNHIVYGTKLNSHLCYKIPTSQ